VKQISPEKKGGGKRGLKGSTPKMVTFSILSQIYM